MSKTNYLEITSGAQIAAFRAGHKGADLVKRMEDLKKKAFKAKTEGEVKQIYDDWLKAL